MPAPCLKQCRDRLRGHDELLHTLSMGRELTIDHCSLAIVHLRDFFATESWSAPVPRIGTLTLVGPPLGFLPYPRDDRFPRSPCPLSFFPLAFFSSLTRIDNHLYCQTIAKFFLDKKYPF